MEAAQAAAFRIQLLEFMEMYLNDLIWMQLDLAAHKATAQIRRD